MVSGASALVRIVIADAGERSRVSIRLEQKDITEQFRAADDGSLQALVSGLRLGANTIVVTSGKGVIAKLTLTNHSRNGPIFSGPHQRPWLCQTQDFKLPDGTTLGPAQDADCNVPTKVMYLYMSAIGSTFKVLPSTSEAPLDVKKTVTSDGRVVNYIVRLETGTVNRGIYQFAVLHDPTNDAEPSPLADRSGWNRRSVYVFGGNASAGYLQGTGTGGVMNDLMLSQGYAVLSSTLNVFGVNANDVLSAESASMTIETFVKEFGRPLYVMGWGGSGGSMQQYLIANNYPGILDGITPQSAFADLQSILPAGMDCALMSRAFSQTSATWTDAQKAAVSGYMSYQTCSGLLKSASTMIGWEDVFSPSWIVAKQTKMTAMGFDISNCHSALPTNLTYDPKSNPNGARCDIYSNAVNQMGIDPATGRAARALDNIGVQYGLAAFRKGMISAEQFVELNEKVGGYDNDGNFQVGRSAASPLALDTSYRFGRINEASNLDRVPIIDWRYYADPDAHNAIRSITTRARLIRATGSAGNQAILRGVVGSAASLQSIVLDTMDRWLSAMAADRNGYSRLADKVVANRPKDLVDACYTAAGVKVAEPADAQNSGTCGKLFPYYTGPRMAAGGPITDDVLKCQLKPLERADYPPLSNDQIVRLRKVFVAGVCDYSKPSVGFATLSAPWLTYVAPGRAVPMKVPD